MSIQIGFWMNVLYGKTELSKFNFGLGGLRFWSKKILVEGDQRLKNRKPEEFLGFIGWIKKVLIWKKRVVLEVVGNPQTHFVVGYQDDSLVQCKIINHVRKVSEGPFQMRVGPSTINFFVVSENEEVLLRSCGCIYRETRQPSELGFLQLDLY